VPANKREKVKEPEYRYRAKGMVWPHWKTLDKHRVKLDWDPDVRGPVTFDVVESPNAREV
jgi:hypothetical protein